MEAIAGVVTLDGLAQAPAGFEPPDNQTAALGTTRDGQVVVRLADAAGLPEGTERFTERVHRRVPVGALTDRLVVTQRPCRLTQMIGYVNGEDPDLWIYVQIFDQVTTLTDGDVPIEEFPVNQRKGVFAYGFTEFFERGLIVGFSTTQGTYTSGTDLGWCSVKALVNGGPIAP